MKKITLTFLIICSLPSLASSLAPITIDYCINKSELPLSVKISSVKNFEHLLNIESELPITFQYNGKENSSIPKKIAANHLPFLIFNQHLKLKKENVDFANDKLRKILDVNNENSSKINLLDLALPNINIFNLYLSNFEEIKLTTSFQVPIAYYYNDQFFQNNLIFERTDKGVKLSFQKPNDIFDLIYTGPPEEEKIVSILLSSELELKKDLTITFVKVLEKESPEHLNFINNKSTLYVNKNVCTGVNVSSDRVFDQKDIEKFKVEHTDLKKETIERLVQIINSKQFKLPIFNQEKFSGNGIDVVPCSTIGKMIKHSFDPIDPTSLYSMSYEAVLKIPETETATLNYIHNNQQSKVTIYRRYKKSLNSIDMRDSSCGIKCPKNIADIEKTSKYQSIIFPKQVIDDEKVTCFNL